MAWVSLIVRNSNLSGCGGHTLLAIATHNSYRVFHLVGSRESSSGGSGHNFYNSTVSIEEYRWAGNAISCGGMSGRSVRGFTSILTALGWANAINWYRRNGFNAIESQRFVINNTTAENIIRYCEQQSRRVNGQDHNARQETGVFSLIGGQIKLGTNCISWAYNTLRRFGVTFDRKMYGWSFVSPRKAVESGGGFQLMP